MIPRPDDDPQPPNAGVPAGDAVSTSDRESWYPVGSGFPQTNAVQIRLQDGTVRTAQWVVAKEAWLVGRTLLPPEDVTHWRPFHFPA